MQIVFKAQELLNQWKHTNDKIHGKYIHKKLPFDKEIEIDIDGSIYVHIQFPYINLQFHILKSYFDSVFTKNYETKNSYEYKEGYLSLSREEGHTCISYKISESLLQDFLDWLPNIIEVYIFIKNTIENN